MWKRVLAALSVPVASVVIWTVVMSAMRTFGSLPAGSSGYRTGFAIGTGLGVLFMGIVLFFWVRWILRVLVIGERKQQPPPGR